jgi:hypothetical protein
MDGHALGPGGRRRPHPGPIRVGVFAGGCSRHGVTGHWRRSPPVSHGLDPNANSTVFSLARRDDGTRGQFTNIGGRAPRMYPFRHTVPGDLAGTQCQRQRVAVMNGSTCTRVEGSPPSAGSRSRIAADASARRERMESDASNSVNTLRGRPLVCAGAIASIGGQTDSSSTASTFRRVGNRGTRGRTARSAQQAGIHRVCGGPALNAESGHQKRPWMRRRGRPANPSPDWHGAGQLDDDSVRGGFPR